MSQFLSQALNLTRFVTGQFFRNSRQLNALPGGSSGSYQPTTAIPNAWSINIVREKCDNTYRQNETKRVKKLGYYAKMKTRSGRMQIMRRILKGRFVLTH